MSLTNTGRDALLGTLFLEEQWSLDSHVLSLHTADPGDDGDHEVQGGGYARQAVTFTREDTHKVSNDAGIEFDDMPAVTITHVGLSAQGATGLILAAPLTQPRTLQAGDTLRFKAGTFTITVG